MKKILIKLNLLAFFCSNIILSQEFISGQQYEMKKRELNYNNNQLYLAEHYKKCECNNYNDIPESLISSMKRNILSELNSRIVSIVKSKYYEKIQEKDNSYEEEYISTLEVKTLQMPIPGVRYYIAIDNNNVKMMGYININDVTTKVNEVNQNFYNASLKARRNYSQNLRNANVSQALKNLAEIHAYKSSIIPYGDYSNKYLSIEIDSELSKILGNVTITSDVKMLDGIRYLHPVDRKIKITAKYKDKPLEGLLLRATVRDGLSDWENNSKELRATNNNGHTQIKLGRILSKQPRQTILVSLDIAEYKKRSQRVNFGNEYLFPAWYDRFESNLNRDAETIEIPINVETDVYIFIPPNVTYSNEFRKNFTVEKGVKLTDKDYDNKLKLMVYSEKISGRNILISSLINDQRSEKARFKSEISYRPNSSELDNEIKKHVKGLLKGLNKGEIEISGEDNISIAIDKKSKGKIKDGKKLIALDYGKHEFTFSKPGFWDLDTSMVLKQSYQEFYAKLQPVKLEMTLGLPFPQRSFSANIKSKQNRKNYLLQFQGGQFNDFNQPNINIDQNNVVHFYNEKEGTYIFKLFSPGRVSYEEEFILDGKTNNFHQIVFQKPTGAQILNLNKLLFPGNNQRFIGYNKMGWFFNISSIAVLAYSAYSYNESRKFLDQYKGAKVAYETLRDSDQSTMDEYRSAAEREYNSYTKYRNHSMLSNAAFMGLGTASLIHVSWEIWLK